MKRSARECWPPPPLSPALCLVELQSLQHTVLIRLFTARSHRVNRSRTTGTKASSGHRHESPSPGSRRAAGAGECCSSPSPLPPPEHSSPARCQNTVRKRVFEWVKEI
ncbi:hypothetical protein EYF80_014428 [Liparis tanakae]|uniref:Uncharacterized protein n=1 Tax=Liparis tanakae TaxID=230148 RepID=A0A4Z2ICD4_9TELE|nr:hypothetical protein EYF80_014428 [Liparis tanakae]